MISWKNEFDERKMMMVDKIQSPAEKAGNCIGLQQEALDSCTGVLAFPSENVNISEWCAKEINYAIEVSLIPDEVRKILSSVSCAQVPP